MKKLNCWEFKKCGRDPKGANIHELGVCPTSTEMRLNKIHGGTNAGRACWIVSGSMCGGSIQGTFAKKFDNCFKCDFYKTVKNEEYANFELSAVLLSKIR